MKNLRLLILALILFLLAFFSFNFALANDFDSGYEKARDNDRDQDRDRDYGDWEFREETVSTRGVVDGDVFTIDVPEGWDFDAEVDWLPEELPIYTIYFVMYDDEGTSLLGLLPITSYVWFTDPWLQEQMPEGFAYSGSTTVLEPRDPDEYLEELLIPYLEDIYRDQVRIRNFEIVDIENRNDLADDYVEMTGVEDFGDYYECTAAVAHLEYNEDGVDVEEDVSVIIGVHEEPIIGISTYSMETWYSWSMLVSVVQKAPVGELDYMEGLYEQILGSIVWDQDFLDDYWDAHEEALGDLHDRQDEQFENWQEAFRGDEEE